MCHAPAFFRTAPAGGGALLAMIVLMLRAFFAAFFADFRAHTTERPGKVAATRHE